MNPESLAEVDKVEQSTQDEEPSLNNRFEVPVIPAHMAESIRLISKGLGDTRVRWLRMLCGKLKETSDNVEVLKLRGLKPHHCRVMLDRLEECLRSIGEPGQGSRRDSGLKARRQTYLEDKERCSLAGVHFNGIISFLTDGYERFEYEALRRFAKEKLKSRHGKVYYAGFRNSSEEVSTEIIKQKRLIAELLREALYIQQMSPEEEAISE
ncbi:hypothetical protein D3C81_1605300 [compost metagenome]